jgi:exosome complex component CSL4
MKASQIVLPGDLIGTSEEFIPGYGVYEERGKIFACVAGEVAVGKDKTVSVEPKTNPVPLLRKGDVIVGRIVDIKNSIAVVEIARKKGSEDRELANIGLAALHISNIKKEYVSQIDDELKHFDVIKARVLDENSLQLTIAEDNLGVIHAICRNCKVVLTRKGSKLICPSCGRIERRKLSVDYGSGAI